MAFIARLRPPHPPATPTGHTHQPHPPATPTSHTHRHTYLLHPPATSISPMTHVCGGCVCQVGMSGRCVRWACQVGVAHLPDTPTWHTYLLLLQPLPCVHATHVSGRCVRWACQVGVSDCQVGVSHLPTTPTCHRGISENLWQSSIRIIQNYIIDSTRL